MDTYSWIVVFFVVGIGGADLVFLLNLMGNIIDRTLDYGDSK